MTKKVRLTLWIEASLSLKFRQFVAEQYGQMGKGLLSFEAAQALQSWVSTHKDTQRELIHKPVNPMPNVFTLKQQVKDYLVSTFDYDPQNLYKLRKEHLITAISALRGTDKRTIEKWMRLFEKYKVIKWVTPSVVEFLA